jgi:hypothetical protein
LVKQLFAVLALSVAALAGPITAAQEKPVNPDAKLLADFHERVENYVALRKKAEGGGPPLEKGEDPAQIQQAQLGLRERIKSARAGAKHGDIFTPPLVAHFRMLLRPPAADKTTKEILKDDNPGSIPFKVNERYPENEPRATAPPKVLQNLPKLPEGEDVEYRFIAKHLILLDARSNLVVDYVPNAIP